jgi:protein-disulfide isomerase
MLKPIFILLLCLSGSLVLRAADVTSIVGQSGSTVVAEVDGVKITLADFERSHPLALFQAENSYYEAEKKAIDAYMDDYLLERQAKTENLSVQALLELHVNGQIAKDPSDEALKVYYEGLDTTESFESMRDKIKDHLRERRIGKAKDAYIQSLRKQATVVVTVAPPRTSVSLANANVREHVENAPLTLVEYADYECPYCQQIAPDLAKIEAEYKGRIAFVYKDFPLPMHPHAQKAAEAAQCAGIQNKYWDYHDALLSSKQLEVPQLKATASALGLDVNAFNTCLDSGQGADQVKKNFNEGLELGITGTPSFVVNGRFISGSIPYDQLRIILEEELRSGQGPASRAALQ